MDIDKRILYDLGGRIFIAARRPVNDSPYKRGIMVIEPSKSLRIAFLRTFHGCLIYVNHILFPLR
jgi:hypothetical protein